MVLVHCGFRPMHYRFLQQHRNVCCWRKRNMSFFAHPQKECVHKEKGAFEITSQRLLDQSQAGVYRGKRHIPPQFGLFGPIRVPYPKGLNC